MCTPFPLVLPCEEVCPINLRSCSLSGTEPSGVRHCEEPRDETISTLARLVRLLRGVYTEHIRGVHTERAECAQCGLRECACNDKRERADHNARYCKKALEVPPRPDSSRLEHYTRRGLIASRQKCTGGGSLGDRRLRGPGVPASPARRGGSCGPAPRS